MEVMSLEDVYWVEDNAVRAALGKDLPRWIQARQTLPTSKEDLETLKADLWSAVVKNSQHQDAWTWGTFSLLFFANFVRLHNAGTCSRRSSRNNFLSFIFNRWNVGSFCVSSRVSDLGCYDTTSSSTRGKALFAAICDWKIFITEQLPSSLCMG